MDLGNVEKETRYEPFEEPVPSRKETPVQTPKEETVPV